MLSLFEIFLGAGGRSFEVGVSVVFFDRHFDT